MQADRLVDRLISAVRNRADDRLAEAEMQAGVAGGYLRKAQFTSRNIMLSKFLRICLEAKVDPGAVFAEVFPRTECDPDMGLPLGSGSDPGIVMRARKRLKEASDGVMVGLPTLDPVWLEQLDELRYDDPRFAIKKAEHAIEFVSLADIPWLLGVWASACRLMSRYAEALRALQFALDMAREQGHRQVEVDLLQRSSFVVASVSGNYWAALKISERAAALCVREGSLSQLGRILVDQGIFLGSLEQNEEAEAAFIRGLKFLDPEERRNRVAALQGLAIHHWVRSLPQEALGFIEQAAELVRERFEVGKLDWIRGRILADLRQWDACYSSFEGAIDHLVATSPVDAALCACDHIRSLLRGGCLDEAGQRARAMRMLVEPLGENLIAAGAVRDLIRCEHEGQQLTEIFVNSIVRRLEKGRQEIPHRP